MTNLHEFKPDPDDAEYCECGLPKKNRRHADAAVVAKPLPSAGRNHTHLSVNSTANSFHAGMRAFPKSGTIKLELLTAISAVDATRGMTDRELEQALPTINVNSLRPRRHDLVDDGWLEPVRNDSGQQVTRGGFTAWRLTAAGRHQWAEQVA